MKTTNLNNKEPVCPCKRKKCARFGDCEACRAHHLEEGSPPYCERPAGRRKKPSIGNAARSEDGRDE